MRYQKSLIDYANDVEKEMGVSGTTAGIYRRVWVEAFVRWEKNKKRQEKRRQPRAATSKAQRA